ncbi:MAG: hypothetical protein C3F02_03310 [Parcubacteria group bacterium]|nr:MAG: hypothetical protein C3F02_03310 [Parcubacteria group bacterium]
MSSENSQNILDKFTFHFKKVLIRAQNLALAKKHREIEPADLFVSLAQTKGSLGSDILTKQKINLSLFETINMADNYEIVGLSAEQMPQPSEAAQAVIEKAVVTAYKYQHRYIGTEHLLLGLLESTNDALQKLLIDSQLDTKNLKQHLIFILKSTSKFNDLATSAEEDLREINNLTGEPNLEISVLESYTVNLTSREIQKKIDPVIGRSRELDRLIEILSRRTKNNPVLLGDAGVGKTAIIEGLAKRITENKVPDVLLSKTILNLDISGLLAGTMYRGEFENRLKQVISEVKGNPNIILFIDELHTIMGAGATTGSLDAANILKPALARGELRCIGATTFEEYKKHIESDRALERRFQPIIINESSEDETFEILKGIKANYEAFHRVFINEEALRTAVALSQRFLPDRKLPDKAIDLIDEAAARFKVKHTKENIAKKIKELQDQLEDLRQIKKQAILAENYLQALDHKNKENALLTQLGELEVKAAAARDKNLGEIDRQHVQEIISEMTGVPVADMTSDENRRLLKLENNLRQEIFGQARALTTITNTIRKAKVGLHDKRKPTASFMFLGPSGVGKTETAKQIARYVFGGSQNMLRLDMSEFAEKFNSSKLIGAPAGYVGYKEGNKLTDFVKNKPYSLILFDEIEKAHPDVFNLLLPILEEGEITDATGRTVNFRNCVIVMTSNIGLADFNTQAQLGFNISDEAISKKNSDWQELSQRILATLPNYFPPEFSNRLDNIIIFDPLDKPAARKIIRRELHRLAERLAERKITLKISDKVLNYLLVKPLVANEGARGLKRLVDEYIANPLATRLLAKKIPRATVSVQKEKIIFN